MYFEDKQKYFYQISFSLFGKLNAGALSFEETLACVEGGVRLEKSLREHLRSTYALSVQGEESWNALIGLASSTFAKEPHLLLTLASNFFRVALLTGELSSRDDALIRMACNRFRFPSQVYQNLREEFDPNFTSRATTDSKLPHQRSLSESCLNALAFLGCTASSSISEIKKSYRHLARLYHPDMHSERGSSGEIRRELRDGFLSLQKAYELVKKEFRFE